MFNNLEGKRIPDVTFRTRRAHEWVDLTTEETDLEDIFLQLTRSGGQSDDRRPS